MLKRNKYMETSMADEIIALVDRSSPRGIKKGYFLKKLDSNKRYVTIYWSIGELRLCCGEVTLEEIAMVEVREIR